VQASVIVKKLLYLFLFVNYSSH